MTWLKDIFINKSNEAMEQEQLLYQLKEAQNATMEIGNLLSQAKHTQPDQNQVQYLDELNANVGDFLNRLRQRINREAK